MFNDKISQSLAEAAKKCMGEELKGNQHKLDANKNGKIDADDFDKLRSKKEVEEGWKKSVKEELKPSSPPKNTDVADKSYLKTMGKKPGPLHNVGKGLKAFVQGKPEPMESVEVSEEESLLEYQSTGGVYKHKGTYGTEKSLEAGETDWDKEDKKAATFVKPEKKKYGARQNRNYNTKTYKESFTGMLDAYKDGGIKGLFESLQIIEEEPTNDEFKKELDKQQAKSEGKAKQADVAKAAVQAVQYEETEYEFQKRQAQHHEKLGNTQRAKYHTEKMKDAKERLGESVNSEEVEQVEERTLTEPEMKKREEIVKSMKKGIQGFKDRYGDRAKEVMYATATKQAKKD